MAKSAGGQKFGEPAVTLLKSAAGVIVLDVVKNVEAMSPSAGSDEKRRLALNQLKADARLQAMGVGTSLINLLIELAVQSLLKQSFVPAC